ncbi:MAG: methyl-accepting chemotaxis protein [Firmicutes bacterium]|nr:methyl-accepting chemotaxis protein [Bacillota bacterium]
MNFGLSFGKRIIFSVGILLLAVVLIIIVTSNNRAENLILTNETKQNEFVTDLFYQKMDEYLDVSRSVIVPIATDQEIVDLFANGERDKLIEKLKPTFADLKERGYYNIQFNVPPSTAFARLNRPDDFDDDISSIRPSVVVANEKQEEVMGLEGGKAGYGFRVLVPVFDNEEFVGTVETGLRFNESFLEDVKEVAPGDYYIYNYGSSGEPEELLSQASSTDDNYQIDSKLLEKVKETGETQYGLTNDRMHSVIAMPYHDFSGELKGYVKAVFSREEIMNRLAANKRFSALIAISSILLALVLLYIIVTSAVRPISKLDQAVSRVAQGDLTGGVNVNYKSNDEIGSLIKSFGQMFTNIKSIIIRIQGNSEKLASHSQEMASSSEEVSATVEEVASTTNEVAATSEQGAENAGEAAKESEQVQQVAEEGNKAVQETVEKMQSISQSSQNVATAVKNLGEQSNQIGEIISTITNIADQTNLLALNAAIEAARAGEHGRGFAVVAEEVRKLAEQSAGAAGEITGLIEKIQVGVGEAVTAIDSSVVEVDDGVHVANNAGASLEQIIKAIEKNTTVIQDVATGSNQANEGMQQLSASNEQITSTVQQISGAAQELANIAGELQNEVVKFNLEDLNHGIGDQN